MSNMLSYRPKAEYMDSNGMMQRLWTYDDYPTNKKALEVINNWDSQFNLKHAWIDVYDENREHCITIAVEKKWELGKHLYLKEIPGRVRVIVSEEEALKIVRGEIK